MVVVVAVMELVVLAVLVLVVMLMLLCCAKQFHDEVLQVVASCSPDGTQTATLPLVPINKDSGLSQLFNLNYFLPFLAPF